jgi:hypothetical protein
MLVDVEQVQFAAQLAVVALLGLFQHVRYCCRSSLLAQAVP